MMICFCFSALFTNLKLLVGLCCLLSSFLFFFFFCLLDQSLYRLGPTYSVICFGSDRVLHPVRL